MENLQPRSSFIIPGLPPEDRDHTPWVFYFFIFNSRWVFTAAHGLSLAVESEGSSLVAVHKLLIAAARHGL